jgi:hypothetical protein
MNKHLLHLILSGSLLAATSAQAALVINDNFNYGASDLASSYGSWSDGSSNIRYEATSNNITSWSGDADYVFGVAGGNLEVNSSNTWRGAQLSLASGATGELWVSALMQERTNAATDAGVALGFDSDGGYSNSGFSGFGFGISGSGNLMTSQSAAAPAEVAPTTPLPSGYGLYIAKLTVNAGGADDSISIWGFDTAASFGTTEISLGTPVYTASNIQIGDSLTGVWFGGYDNGPIGGSGNLDNLRLSNLAGDFGLQEVLTGAAVPEPSTYAALLGIMALGFVAWRRRG